MTRREIAARVRQIHWPPPSPALRERVLSTTLTAGPGITWADRVWFSRTWRLSALGAALFVLVVDRLPAVPQSVGDSPAPYAAGQALAVDSAARQVGLPPDTAASFARRALSVAARLETAAETEKWALRELDLDQAGRIR